MKFWLCSARLARSLGVLLVPLTVGLTLPSAQAHHGWSWAESEQLTLSGKVHSVSMAPPHPVLQVRDGEGKLWQVDLGNPAQTARSGFTDSSARVGDAITVLGNRNQERQKLHMKAVRITLDGRNFDMYPERIRP